MQNPYNTTANPNPGYPQHHRMSSLVLMGHHNEPTEQVQNSQQHVPVQYGSPQIPNNNLIHMMGSDGHDVYRYPFQQIDQMNEYVQQHVPVMDDFGSGYGMNVPANSGVGNARQGRTVNSSNNVGTWNVYTRNEGGGNYQFVAPPQINDGNLFQFRGNRERWEMTGGSGDVPTPRSNGRAQSSQQVPVLVQSPHAHENTSHQQQQYVPTNRVSRRSQGQSSLLLADDDADFEGSGCSSFESSFEETNNPNEVDDGFEFEPMDSPGHSILPLSLQTPFTDTATAANINPQPLPVAHALSPTSQANAGNKATPPQSTTPTSAMNCILPPNLSMITNLLSELSNVVKSVEDNLSKIDLDIKNSPLPMPIETSTSGKEYLRQLQHTIEVHMEQCHEIENQYMLHCKHLHELKLRYTEFQRLYIQLDLYRAEIDHCMASSEYGDVIFASLFINQQPFPATIKQHLTVDAIGVQFLTAARTRVDISVPVRAELITDWNIGNNKKQSTPMKGHEERFSKDGTSYFKGLKFTVGTGCKAVQVKFRAYLQKKTQKFQFESEPSESFIVMTNTKQWAEAQGILTKKELFKEYNEVTAQYFANVIQSLYIQASRQDPLKAPRPLGPSDFQFLFANKVLKPFTLHQLVTQSDFDRLWSWFGPVLQKIRYQKFLLPMWTAGLFWGFISKAESEQYLERYGAGTFILRFSERMNNGSMAVAYKQSQNTVRHYLIKSKDTSGQGHSLPQFIRETSSLLQFLRLTISESFELKLSLVEKHQALAKIGSKRRKTTDNKGSGYDEDFLDLVAASNNWEI